jgi:hypothetical protein
MAQVLVTNYTGNSDAILWIALAVEVPAGSGNYEPGTATNLSEYGPNLVNGNPKYVVTGQEPDYWITPPEFDGNQGCFIYLQEAPTGAYTNPTFIGCNESQPQNTFKFEKCGADGTKNIYVFYDASGYYADSGSSFTLSAASTAIRSWYSDLVNQEGYTGQLYEIPLVNRRYFNWPCYPYLGSTTGGTLSDGVTFVDIEAGRIPYPGMSPAPLGGGFEPWDGAIALWNSPILTRIANALDLTTGNPLPIAAGYSRGTPGTWGSTNPYGDFAGGDTNYVSIIIAGGGNIHPTQCEPLVATSGGTDRIQPYASLNDITFENNPFGGIPATLGVINPCLATYPNYDVNPDYSGSSIQRDYESYLKVYQDITIEMNGDVEVIYMQIPNVNPNTLTSGQISTVDVRSFYSGIYQAIELVEGSTPLLPQEYSFYGLSPFNETPGWPTLNELLYNAAALSISGYLSFQYLTQLNHFTGFTATTAYSQLNINLQNGAGLKNFGWSVDATMTGFSETQINNDFAALISSGEIMYVAESDEQYVVNNVYKFNDSNGDLFPGCWRYIAPRLDGQPANTLAISFNYGQDCSECLGQEIVYEWMFKTQGKAYLGNNIILASQDAPIEILGPANNSIDIEIAFPYWTAMSSNTTNYPSIQPQSIKFLEPGGLGYQVDITPAEYGIPTGDTVTIGSNGIFTLNWAITSASGAKGYRYVTVDVTGSSPTLTYNGADSPTIMYDWDNSFLPLSYQKYHIIYCQVDPGEFGVLSNEYPAGSSGTACSNWAVEKFWIIQSAGNSSGSLGQIQVGSRMYGANGTYATIGYYAITNAKFTIEGYEANTEKYVVQINPTGVVAAITQCP